MIDKVKRWIFNHWFKDMVDDRTIEPVITTNKPQITTIAVTRLVLKDTLEDTDIDTIYKTALNSNCENLYKYFSWTFEDTNKFDNKYVRLIGTLRAIKE